MENNQPKMATPAQINKLQSLGYQGDAASLTSMQASVAISELLKGSQPTFNNSSSESFESPFGNQQPFYQNDGYQAPKQQPIRNSSATQQQLAIQPNVNYTITTRAGEELLITPEVVDAYVCKGLTPTEFNYFFTICKTYELNPFLKDIYAIKFGSQPATFVIDYKVMQQAADNNPAFDGLEVGIIYLDKNGAPQERKGAYILPGETLIAGWCDVFRKDRSHANRTYALYSENVKLTKEGEPNTNWANKPVFMCVKVAKAQALRETFPNMFSNNTYTSDEMPERDEELIINQDFKESSVEEVNKKQEKKTASKKSTPVETNEWPE